MQCCPRGSRGHCIIFPVQFCLDTLGTTLHRSKLYAVSRKAPDNIASEKIQCNVVLILLGQHCTAQNPMQYCPRGSRQHCIRKNSVQCCLDTLETTLHRSKLYAMLPEKLQTKLRKKKSCANLS